MPLRFDQVSGGIVVDPPLLLRAFFLLATCAILLVNFTPALRERFLAYGSRTPLSPPTKHVPRKGAVASYSSRLETLVLSHLDYLSSLQLPHRYFLHFYIVSVTLSLFWATVFLCGINVEAFLSSAFAISIEVPAKSTMTVGQIALGWILMSVQGLRRLYECVAFAKPSKAKMWIGHWVLGILFYVGMSCAIWVDGIRTYKYSPEPLSAPLTNLFIAKNLYEMHCFLMRSYI
ncbi:MAG: 3-oxo-5-alpha-steroid 4-dehydrogenase [Trizodia sp. TS-e1964]|nr:MAG: 3-oxo-5-alpha-steroid 4-dehydrogenase [Trizodia sp. TS-e1964]